VTLAELIAREEQAARHSDTVARAFDQGRATYKELKGAEDQLHRAIVARCQAIDEYAPAAR
jgi:hypothetical protein